MVRSDKGGGVRGLWPGFAALCLLAGSGWLFNLTLASPLPVLLGQGLRDGLLALLFWGASMVTGARTAPTPELRAQTLLAIAGWSSLLLAVPGWLAIRAAGHVSGLTAALVTTLIPAVVVFLVAQADAGFGAERGGLGLLGPALAGFGGAALLLPYALPASNAGKLWLLAMFVSAALSGLAIFHMHRLLAASSLLAISALVAAAACVAALLLQLASGEDLRVGFAGLAVHNLLLAGLRELAAALLLDGPVLLLMVWLLTRLTPVAYSVVYLAVPLVSVTEAFLLMHPITNWTFPVGIVLLMAGAFVLLRSAEATPLQVGQTDTPSP